MLHPEERQSLTEALRPPTGWKLDLALGTTYTLDLMTLLTVPLSFTFFDIEDSEGRPIADPVRVMEALRRYAHRVHVFCQSGRIADTKPNRLLNVFIEQSVHEVKAPRGGVFHPKVWALRFVDADARAMYRLLVASRNLTFDRSWDTIVCLEGLVEPRQNAFAMNHPLGDFIAALPGMCVYGADAETRRVVDLFHHELRRTKFEGTEEPKLVGFHPLGFKGENVPVLTGSGSAFTVIAPFVSDELLRKYATGKVRCTLLSRRESLDQLSEETLRAFAAVYIMDQAVETEMTAEEDGEERSEEQLVGLHAKCFVVERDFRARVYTGSANATNAAFSTNVEMLVALEGGYRNFGSAAIFGSAETHSDFMKLLRPYMRSGTSVEPDPLEAEFEELRDGIVGALTDATLGAGCELQSDGSYILTLAGTISLPRIAGEDASLQVRPLSLDEKFFQSIGGAAPPRAVFRGLSFEAITSFFVFSIEWTKDNRGFRHRFVLNVPLTGAPADRTARVMGLLLKDERQVMRLLLMILGIVDPVEMARRGEGPYIDQPWKQLVNGGDTQPLFELLVRAVSRDPRKIDDIEGIVRYLRAAENGTRLLPEDFDEIWLPVLEAARRGMAK